MSKLGVHIAHGSRNGYGLVCNAKPAVVLSVNDGGALIEASDRSGGHTFTIFRDTTVYLDAPHGIDQSTPEQAIQIANSKYPALKAVWQQNPADYYTVLNEPAAHDLGVMPSYAAYEKRVMELAEADGIRLCVLNLATGTPGYDVWQQMWLPHIARAFKGSHIYGRHAYDSAGVIRASEEAKLLLDKGLNGGVVFTELGWNGGYGYSGDAHFVAAAEAVDDMMMDHPNIIGCCLWTLGDWNGANWQTATDEVAAYLSDNPTPKWQPPEIQGAFTPPDPGSFPPPKPGESKDDYLIRMSRLWQEAYGVHLNLDAWTVNNAGQHGFIVIREIYPKWEGVQLPLSVSEDVNGNRILHIWENNAGRMLIDRTGKTEFTFKVWPTDYRRITQAFGARPEYYDQWGLPGHEGVDIAAPNGTPVYAVNSGVVYRADNISPTYGNQIGIDHGNGYRTRYAHMQEFHVSVGDSVLAGQRIGLADNTGNSDGAHLHLRLEIEGNPAPGYPADIADPTPYLMPFNPELPGQSPTGDTIDLMPYFLPNPGGYGPVYLLQRHDGSQEMVQIQGAGGWFYVVKGTGGVGGRSEFEELFYDDAYIWRGYDTSPGYGLYYLQYEPGRQSARWVKRKMRIGETFVGGGHTVQFYDKGTCQAVDVPWNGSATNITTLFSHYPRYQFPTGVVMEDVVKLGREGGEIFWLKKGVGMVGWQMGDRWSFVAQVFAPGERPDLVKETLC